MYRYRPAIPRAALAAAAVALTALTLGGTVVLPARLDVTEGSLGTLARAPSARPATEVTIHPARIHVVGVIVSDVAAVRPPIATPRQKPEG